VDRGAGTLYVAGLATAAGARAEIYKVTALDVKSGINRPGWPAAIAPPSVSGVAFDPSVQQQRGALTLDRGVLYVPFGGYFGDCGAYHGWIVGLPTGAPERQEAYATAGRKAGIWAAGGVAVDPQGRLYAATGNGASAAGRAEFGNSVIRLMTSPLRFTAAPRDFFTPSNAARLSETDTDLGSTAPLVLPDLPQSSTPHLVFIAGKQGVGYLINRDDMGGVGHGSGITGEAVYSRCIFGTCEGGGFAVGSATAYWDGGVAGRLILVPGRGRQPAPCGGTGGIVALRLGLAPGARRASFGIAWCSPSMQDPGAPSVSGEGPDGGVVWVVDHRKDALYALDARSGRAVYVSHDADVLHGTHQFITPAVWGGRVYVGDGQEVVAYGLQ
jgi:hypothetical protein